MKSIIQTSKKKYTVTSGKSENQKISDLNVNNKFLNNRIKLKNIIYYDSVTTANIIQIKFTGPPISGVSNDNLCFLYKKNTGIFCLENSTDLGKIDSNYTNSEISFYFYDETSTSLTSNGYLFMDLIISTIN